MKSNLSCSRLSILFFCLTLVLAFGLVACGGTETPPVDDTTAGDVTQLDAETLTVMENGASEFIIVRSDTRDDGAIAGISKLYKSIEY